jgi:16S rRNA (cytosine1402-N4)-methyltransferase
MEQERKVYHMPVLLRESVEGLNVAPKGVYVDVTFGGGGHSREILSLLDEGGRVYGFDQDADAECNAPTDKRFVFVKSNFRYLGNFMRFYGEGCVDGVLADLGVSWHHFDEPQRGFSFRFGKQKPDMRMNQQSTYTAANVLNTSSEERLGKIFSLYGEVPEAHRLATAIIRYRMNAPVDTMDDLLEIIQTTYSSHRFRGKEKKIAAQIFQALRIEVNDEFEALREMLTQTASVIREGGRLVILTYHSLEDRIVKHFLKTGNFDGRNEYDFFGNTCRPFRPLSAKVITPSAEEIATNPRARSAKLRIAVRNPYNKGNV